MLNQNFDINSKGFNRVDEYSNINKENLEQEKQPEVSQNLVNVSSIDENNNNNNNNNLPNQINNIMISQTVIDPSHCNKMWEEWIKSLWFTPTGFKKQTSIPNFKKLYVPFYLWSTIANSEYSGDIGKHIYEKNPVKQHETHHLISSINVNTNKKVKDTIWHHANEKREIFYKDYLVCGSNDEKLIDLIPHTQPTHDLNLPLESKDPEELLKKGCEVHLPLEQSIIWEIAKKGLEERESIDCEKKLLNSHGGDILNNFKISTHFSGTEAKLIYFPYYYTIYFSENTNKVFIVNGHSGEYHGERPPVGLGKIGDFGNEVKDFFNTVVGNKEKDGIFSGEELSKMDETNVYDPNLYYVTFSRSNTYLLHQSIGYIKLKNESSTLVLLEGQKRKERQKSKYHIKLEPYVELKLPYKGHWCFAILNGDKEAIKVLKVVTTGGDNIKDV